MFKIVKVLKLFNAALIKTLQLGHKIILFYSILNYSSVLYPE